eukprot:TRINITY_DN11258_c0_g1_i1.p1 TRINITY_DN11258_c0_g1~~TRINITY_DN11258_c0_g1_i1.p1  ORF type:complete len:466 (-),score=107.72 TRINITY_DN11258_c0_g1_i1:65-1462(-)
MGDYSLKADPFDYLGEGHPWKAKGMSLTLDDVVKDPKNKNAVKHIQRKLWWLLSQLEKLSKGPTTQHRPLISRLGLVLALEQFQKTLYSSIPKGKTREESFETLTKIIQTLQKGAKDELTADTRAVLHEFRNMSKTISFLGETEIGIKEVEKDFYHSSSDETDPTGVDGVKFGKAVEEEFTKLLQNYQRIRLPFTQDANSKLATCARHYRPLVSSSLNVHAQEVYNFATDIHEQLSELKAQFKVRLSTIRSTMDGTVFAAYLRNKTASLPSGLVFPRYLPNITLEDPTPILVATKEDYLAILLAYAASYRRIESLISPWSTLIDILEMWQRTCIKADKNIVAKPKPSPAAPTAATTPAVSPDASAPAKGSASNADAATSPAKSSATATSTTTTSTPSTVDAEKDTGASSPSTSAPDVAAEEVGEEEMVDIEEMEEIQVQPIVLESAVVEESQGEVEVVESAAESD